MSDDIPLPLDLARLQTALENDPEFRLQSRALTTTFRFVIGEVQHFLLTFRDGELAEIDPAVTPLDPFDIQLLGSEEHWACLLAATPAPFYQDFFPAMLHHGFRIEGDMETVFAYYPAIRRMQDLLRQVAKAEVTA